MISSNSPHERTNEDHLRIEETETMFPFRRNVMTPFNMFRYYVSRRNIITASDLGLIIDDFEDYNNKNKVSKYKFHENSNYSCGYCFENFKPNQIMCISSCYHYWCDDCNSKLNSNKCGFCKVSIKPNEFIDTFGESGWFKKNQHCLELIQIIKEDIDLIDDKIDDEINDEIDGLMDLLD